MEVNGEEVLIKLHRWFVYFPAELAGYLMINITRPVSMINDVIPAVLATPVNHHSLHSFSFLSLSLSRSL